MDTDTNTQNEVAETTVTEVHTEEVNAKKPFYKSLKLYFFLVLLLVIVGAVIWTINVLNVYKEASVYKKVYDTYQEEKAFCNGIKGTSQSKEVFDYCDRLAERFKDAE
jgi:hypothetical protein